MPHFVHTHQAGDCDFVLDLQVLLVDDRPAADPQAELKAEPTPAESAQQHVRTPTLQVAPSHIPTVNPTCRHQAVMQLSRPRRQSRAVIS